MNKYDADRTPESSAWLELDEQTRIDLVAAYHRRHHPGTPRIPIHSTFHVIVENQLAEHEPAAVQTLTRLQAEGLTRHDAIHAIGSVLAAHVFDVLTENHPAEGDRNVAYAADLRALTAEKWRSGR